jgi:hypothetical protein
LLVKFSISSIANKHREISYKEGSAEFEAILSQSEQSKTFESEYSVSGDKFTLKTDNNDDGDYLDGDEVTVYTKQ